MEVDFVVLISLQSVCLECAHLLWAAVPALPFNSLGSSSQNPSSSDCPHFEYLFSLLSTDHQLILIQYQLIENC